MIIVIKVDCGYFGTQEVDSFGSSVEEIKNKNPIRINSLKAKVKQDIKKSVENFNDSRAKDMEILKKDSFQKNKDHLEAAREEIKKFLHYDVREIIGESTISYLEWR